MSDPRPNAQEDKDVKSAADSPGPTQGPLQSHTSSPKNNATALSSDEHEKNPLNGARPNPFVYSGVPAVPRAGDSLPPGTLVNGPASHPTSEVRRVLNKGTVSPGNVLDAAPPPRPGEAAGPQASTPPGELQSDARRSTAGLVPKTLPTQPGAANAPPSHREENESKAPRSAPLPGDGSGQTHVGRPPINNNEAAKTRAPRDINTELSEGRADDDDDDETEATRWDSAREPVRSLRNGRIVVNRRLQRKARATPLLTSQIESKHNTRVRGPPGTAEEVYNSLNHTHRGSPGGVGADKFDSANKYVSFGKKPNLKCPTESLRDQPGSTTLDAELLIGNNAGRGRREQNGSEETCNFNAEPEQPKTEHSESDPLFALCDVNFQEKIHLHRHMMYHLDGHDQVENVPYPFICRECGRSFCDSGSLMKHIIIHQERLEKLMEEIKGLKNLENQGRNATLQCPRCLFASNCPKTFVQHAKAHENVKHYYFCEECSYVALTEEALEAHLNVMHLKTHHQHQQQHWSPANDTGIMGLVQFQCKLCSFTCQDRQILERHSEREHQEPLSDEWDSPVFHKPYEHTDSKVSRLKFSDRPKTADSELMHLMPDLCNTQPTFWKRADLTCWAGERADAPDSYKILHSSQFRCSDHFTAPMLSQSLCKTDKRGKLPPPPGDKIDMTPAVPYAEEDSPNNLEQTNSPSNTDTVLTARRAESDQTSQGQKSDLASASSQVQAALKSPSKSNMSAAPSLPGQMNDGVFPKLNQRRERDTGDAEGIKRDHEDGYNFSGHAGGATAANFLDSGESEKHPCDDGDDDGDDDCSDIQQLIIKEEYIESAVCDDSPVEPPAATTAMPKSEPFEFPLAAAGSGPTAEHKPCPYCPAVFESGVGLSNHVRGHLHRVGLSYNARHMVSPEQVALQDRQPRVRRKIPSGTRKLKKVDKPESHGGHTCPLCWGWFDTKTGLSNHARGHLKRIGTTVTGDKKSPVSVLLELLQDKREHERIVQILNKERFASRPFVSSSQKFVSGAGGGIPLEIQCAMRNADVPMGGRVPKREPEFFFSPQTREGNEGEARRAAAAADKSPSSTLVKLLETRRKAAAELKEREALHTTGKHFDFNVTRDGVEVEARMISEGSSWAHDECDSDQACGHCNTAFPGAVRLSSHLRAFSRRKRFTVLEETSYDFKQKKPRSGHGKKMLSPLNAVEKIYRLTCRFCDLVFQGPLSVQEDWVKHLQRHLMHTSVPHSGTRMVEVLGLHQQMHHLPLEHPNLEHPNLEHSNLEQNLAPLELQVAS